MRLLIITQQPILLKGLEAILAVRPEWEVTAFTGAISEAVDVVRAHGTDVVLIDFEAAEHFGAVLDILEQARPKIALFTRDISPELAHQALKAGVHGILRASAGTERLLDCLASVHAGEFWCDDDLKSSFLQAKTAVLSPRESQLILLISQGLKNKEIANALSISETTVRIYLSAIFRRVGTKDRYELALYGMRTFLQDPRVPTTIGMDSLFAASQQSMQVRFLMLEKPRPRQTVRLSPGRKQVVGRR